MVGYVLIGAILLLLFLTIGGGRVLKLPTWRIGSAMGAVFAFAAAGYLIMRRAWPAAVVLMVIGAWLAASARSPRKVTGPGARPRKPAEKPGRMTETEARSILGVEEGATPEDIQTAYMRLMKRVHPDNGGAPGLAAQLNAARDRLLKKN